MVFVLQLKRLGLAQPFVYSYKNMLKYRLTVGAFSLSLFSSTLFASDAEQLEHGKALFLSGAQPIACSVCHTLKDAGAAGTIGPDLDELQPDADRIRKTLIEGMGVMPSFADMPEDDRNAIIHYVLHAIQ